MADNEASGAPMAAAEPYPYSDPFPVESGSLVFWSKYGSGELQLRREGEEPLVLTPGRGREWGLDIEAGMRQLSLRVASLDGRWAAVCLGDHTFAVATDGSTREAPLLLAEFCGEYFVSSDGKELAIRPQQTRVPDALWTVPFDPPDPAALVRVAEFGEDSTVRVLGSAGPWWLLRFDERPLVALTSDGRSFEEQERSVVAVLPDARALVADIDGAWYVLALDEGAFTELTPALDYTELAGTTDAGTRALIWTKVGEDYQLCSVALDSSNVGELRLLGEPQSATGSVLLLPDTARAIVLDGTDVLDLPLDTERPPRRFAQNEYVRPLGVSQDERWLYGCLENQTLMRLDTDDPAATWVPYDGRDELRADTSERVWLPADHLWTCGERVLPTPGATLANRLIAEGQLEVGSTTKAAAYLRSPDGEIRRVSAQHSEDVQSVLLLPAAQRIYYRTSGSENWWTASLDGSERTRPLPVLNVDTGTSKQAQVLGDRIAFVASKDRSYPDLWVTQGSVAELLVADYADGSMLEEFEGTVLASDAETVFRISLDGSERTVLIDGRTTIGVSPVSTDEPRTTFLVDPVTRQVIVPSEGQLLAAALDGSEAHAPRIIVEELRNAIYSPLAVIGDHALFAAGYVGPNYSEPWMAALDGSDRQQPRRVESWPTGPPAPDEPSGPFVSQDGHWVLVGRSEHSLARLPLSEASVVELDGPYGWLEVTQAPPLEDYVIAESANALWRVPLTPDDGTAFVRLTPDNTAGHFEDVYWLEERGEVLYTWVNYGRRGIGRAAIDGSDAETFRTLLGRNLADFLVERAAEQDPVNSTPDDSVFLEALSPDEEWFVFSSRQRASLMAAYHDAEPFALSGDTDVEQRFIGWVP